MKKRVSGKLSEDAICFYEQLRNQVAGVRPVSILSKTKGMALLLHRGMSAWMEAITDFIPAKSKVQERIIEPNPYEQIELVNLLANMFLENIFRRGEYDKSIHKQSKSNNRSFKP